MILHLSNDLMLVGKVSSWAKSGERPYRSVASLGKLESALATGEVTKVVIDLQFRDLDIPGVAAVVRNAGSDIWLVGYAQHVYTELIEAATEAGFDAVLTRGQFDRQFAEALAPR